MTKINRDKDSWGQDVIYVEECEKYMKQNQDLPIYISKRLHNQDNMINPRLCDIIQTVENYLENSGK